MVTMGVFFALFLSTIFRDVTIPLWVGAASAILAAGAGFALSRLRRSGSIYSDGIAAAMFGAGISLGFLTIEGRFGSPASYTALLGAGAMAYLLRLVFRARRAK